MPFPQRIDTSAVILPVHAVFPGQFRGTFVAVFLFEIVGKPQDLILPGQLLPDLIEFLRIFQRTDGQGLGEIAAALFLCSFCGCLKAETIAGKAPSAAFREMLHALGAVVEIFRNIGAFCKIHRISGGECGNKTSLLLHAGVIFGFRIDIRIVVKYRNPEICGQVFQYIAAAGCAAGVKQKRGNLFFLRKLHDELLQFFLIIPMIHICFLVFYLICCWQQRTPEAGNPVTDICLPDLCLLLSYRTYRKMQVFLLFRCRRSALGRRPGVKP